MSIKNAIAGLEEAIKNEILNVGSFDFMYGGTPETPDTFNLTLKRTPSMFAFDVELWNGDKSELIFSGSYDAKEIKLSISKIAKNDAKDLDQKDLEKFIKKQLSDKQVLQEELNESDDELAMALADYLGITPEEVGEENWDYYGLGTYAIGDAEYAITSSEDEADEAAKKEVVELIDELGVEALNWDNMGGLENFVDMDWAEAVVRESTESYANDIESEPASDDTYESRLAEEMAEAGVDSKEEFVDYLVREAGNPAEYLKDNFEDFLKDRIDADKAAEEVLDTDGRGHLLSRYDGKEITHEFNGTTYYIYRV